MNNTKDTEDKLLEIATQRIKNYNPAKLLSEEEMNIRLDITDKDLADFYKIEIE